MMGFVAGHVLVPSAQAGSAARSTLYGDRVVVLEFHDVSPTDRSTWTMTPQRFDQTIEQLQKSGFVFISPAQLTAFLDHTGKVPSNALLVTFDDGLADVYTYALPVLERYHVPFLFTIIGNRIGKAPTCLTLAEILALDNSGLGVVGAHSWALHGTVTMFGRSIARSLAMTAGESYSTRFVRLMRDGQHIQATIRSLTGKGSLYYAWPFGAYDTASIQAMRLSGFRFFFTSTSGAVTGRTDPTRIPRIDVGENRLSIGQIVAAIADAAWDGNRPPVRAGASLSAEQEQYLEDEGIREPGRMLYP